MKDDKWLVQSARLNQMGWEKENPPRLNPLPDGERKKVGCCGVASL